MKKQIKLISIWCKAGLLTFFFGGLWSTSMFTQTVTQKYVDADATHYYDIKVSTGYPYLYLEAKAADGGKSDHNGGEGAWVSGYLKIGNGPGEVPAGSTLRLIPGQAGQGTSTTNNYTGGITKIGGGGGGSGVAFKGPNANDSWQLLAVVGGGGGAGDLKSGRAATTYTYGVDGQDIVPTLLYNKGNNGNGGSHSGAEAYPGGGAFSDGGGGCPGRAGFQNNVPVGGAGGSLGCGGEAPKAAGGFGFGGGGSAISQGGGGGGGYSGGGGGYSYNGNAYEDSRAGGGGGGGGSYANNDWLYASVLLSFGLTSNDYDGYVSYSYITPAPIRLATADTKCLDLKQTGIYNGDNIQLNTYQNTPTQQWVILSSKFHDAGTQQWVMDGITFRSGKDLSKCLDLDNSNTTNGHNIQLFDCDNTNAQKWIYDGLTQALRSKIDFKKCIDLANSNTANGTNIQLYDCNGSGAQKWIVKGVDAAMPTGTNQRIRLVMNTDKCLDIFGGQTANGTNIQLWRTQDANNSQYFTFDGSQIKMQAHSNKCLDLNNSNTANGNNIQLFDCNNTNAQVWIYDGYAKAFRSGVDPNKCLDVKGGNTSDGTNIELWDCNGSSSQQFVIGQ